jgi:hypothetical protein
MKETIIIKAETFNTTNYVSNSGCALAITLKELGYKKVKVGAYDVDAVKDDVKLIGRFDGDSVLSGYKDEKSGQRRTEFEDVTLEINWSKS